MNKIKLSSVAVLAALIISVSESHAQDKTVTLGIKAGANCFLTTSLFTNKMLINHGVQKIIFSVFRNRKFFAINK